MKPPLKWAGGKRRMLKHILPHVPEDYNRYVEPFAGGAALFFELEPAPSGGCILADTNRGLMNFYRCVRGMNFTDMIPLENTKECYLAIRAAYNMQTREGPRQAARFLYLNKTGYSGLYRENKAGGFNVPFGDRKNPNIYDPGTLLAASKVLKDTDLKDASAFDLPGITAPVPGDFWYLDPPYDQTFNGYGAWDGWADQIAVFELYKDLTDRGAKVLLSSSATPRILELYEGHGTVNHISATYSIRQKAEPRDKAGEILVKNW